MKALSTTLLLLLVTALSACSKDNNEDTSIEMDNTTKKEMKVTIGATSFDVDLEDNSTVDALLSLLPMTVVMNEMNNNEKYCNLSQNLPTNPSRANTVNKGDIMLFGSSTLVVFYKTFNTSYTYTRIGRIENLDDLETILGAGSVRLTFERSGK